jgi:hypothetical protein
MSPSTPLPPWPLFVYRLQCHWQRQQLVFLGFYLYSTWYSATLLLQSVRSLPSIISVLLLNSGIFYYLICNCEAVLLYCIQNCWCRGLVNWQLLQLAHATQCLLYFSFRTSAFSKFMASDYLLACDSFIPVRQRYHSQIFLFLENQKTVHYL